MVQKCFYWLIIFFPWLGITVQIPTEGMIQHIHLFWWVIVPLYIWFVAWFAFREGQFQANEMFDPDVLEAQLDKDEKE